MVKVEKDPKSGCWLWTGALNRRGAGYPQLGVAGKTVRAHRWAYEHFVGPIPEGQTIDHTCETTRCVNPEHLVVMSRGENARRGRERQQKSQPAPASKAPQKSKESTKAVAREREALRLRASGRTFDEIAEHLGYSSTSGAWKAYKRAMAATETSALSSEDRRELELHRIDLILQGLWEAAARGDLAAVDRFEKLSKLRVRIEGMAVAARRGDGWGDEDGDSGSVIGPDRLDRLRERREREAAERARL